MVLNEVLDSLDINVHSGNVSYIKFQSMCLTLTLTQMEYNFTHCFMIEKYSDEYCPHIRNQKG